MPEMIFGVDATIVLTLGAVMAFFAGRYGLTLVLSDTHWINKILEGPDRKYERRDREFDPFDFCDGPD